MCDYPAPESHPGPEAVLILGVLPVGGSPFEAGAAQAFILIALLAVQCYSGRGRGHGDGHGRADAAMRDRPRGLVLAP